MSSLSTYTYTIYEDGGAVKLVNNYDGTVDSHATLGPAVAAVLTDTNNPSAEIRSGTYNLASDFTAWTVISKTNIKCQGLVVISVPQGYASRVWTIAPSTTDVFHARIEGGIYDEQGTAENNWIFMGITPTNSKAVYESVFKNIKVFKADTVLYLKTTDSSWINHNTFDNIYGVAIKYLVAFDQAGTWTTDVSGVNGCKFVNVFMQSTFSPTHNPCL